MARRSVSDETKEAWASSQGEERWDEVRWWQGVPGESLALWIIGPTAATPLGVVKPLGVLSRMSDCGVLDVVTFVVASFSGSRLYGIVVGRSTIGHA
uniref:Uncharacterized protein n=1 Tax=Oryza punctata TaxID=4537 RepID=A0A0E0K0J9_ORYPU